MIRMWRQTTCRGRSLWLLVTVALSLLLVISTVFTWSSTAPSPVNASEDKVTTTKPSLQLKSMLQTYSAPGGHKMGNRIPKIFHQTYKTTMLPVEYKPYIVKCKNLNPDWKYYLWRDEDIVSFISEHFPQYMRKYKKFTMNVQRADFIRYMVLYHYGGVYLDMDVDCVRPFFPKLENYSAFLDQERREHAQILYGRQFTAMNSAMGSVAGHPFYLYMLESVNAVADHVGGAGHTTGPDLLTVAYSQWAQSASNRNYPVTLLEPEVFSPIADTKLHNFRQICSEGQKGPVSTDKAAWLKAGCRLLAVDNWKVDASSNDTVGKHLFLHMGYNWGPKVKKYFNVADIFSPVYLYKKQRM